MADGDTGGQRGRRGVVAPRRPLTALTPHARDAAKVAFLAELAEGSSIAPAAQVAGVSRQTVYQWREADPAFAAAWEAAYEAGTDRIEQIAFRRATEGTPKTVWYQGRPVGETREPSDRLMELMLKARRPEKYRERVDVQAVTVSLSAEELAAARERALSPEVEAAARTVAALPVVEVRPSDA